MGSVADALREDTRRQLERLTPRQRLELAFALAEEDLRMFVRASGRSPADARRAFERAKQRGREPSVVSRRFNP